MPIYEFKCNKCSRKFEELCFSSNSIKEIKCPSCKSRKITKQISLFGFNTGKSGSSSKSKSCCTRSTCGGCHSCH